MFLAVLVLAGCSSNKSSSDSKTIKAGDLSSTSYKKSQSYYRGGTSYSGKNVSLNFDKAKYTIKTVTSGNKKIKVRAYENIVYVSKPVDKKYQTMNIYIPVAYFQGKKINGFTKKTAPILMPNSIGGYMPGEAQTLGTSSTSTDSTSTTDASTTAIAANPAAPGAGGAGTNATGGAPAGAGERAIAEGYIVAAPGARGRTTKNSDGKYTGKAPAAIVDLKAAVRYLKLNSKKLPGNENHILSDGTSAGGAMSALLGASGNNKDYAPYLKAIGAADTSDNIYASFVFCPIMNLENADSAYEWQFNGINSYVNGMHMPGETPAPTTLTSKQKSISNDLKKEFPDYVNGLKLKDSDGNVYKMNSNGSGSFNNLIKDTIKNSAQTAIDKGKNITEKKYPFLTIKNKKVTDVNLTKYNKAVGRMKAAPAFDGVDLSNAENQEMGTATVNKKHFTKYSQDNNTAKNKTAIADSTVVSLMNPMDYIGTNNANSASHWYIRYGEMDANTSIAVPTIFSQKLKNSGKDVNYHLEWNKGHAGDYNLNEMFKWSNKIMK
ncbi:hypothetical protein ABM34_06955 [Companilactobacillus ginsenosidimutans]|uniref:BD-FAE-like domain-containing protein n=2 Tax=Companilactobacillus ginsenosidimutans TaxID=1007676 RepID=A0A0H4R3T1_9LACO|nr:hypothetical protein ABM34_06955 [Companilactobacillus ginsenosidimutans]